MTVNSTPLFGPILLIAVYMAGAVLLASRARNPVDIALSCILFIAALLRLGVLCFVFTRASHAQRSHPSV